MANLSNINNKFLVTTGGNVGINTTSPASKFEVDGSIKVTGITSNIGAVAGLSLSYDSGINYINTWASTPLITSTYNYQAFHISGLEKMRIHTNGNVGIGANSPSAQLHIGSPENTPPGVAGTIDRLIIQPYSNTGGPYIFKARTVSGSEDYLDLYYNTAQIISYGLSGNVGIGEANPSWQLEVSDTGTVRAAVTSTDNNTSGIFFRVFNSGTQVGNGTIATQNNGDMKFFTGTSSEAERMRIDSSGNVTIGTGIIKPAIGGDIAITQGAIGLRINDAASAISPTTATSNNDNAVDLGVSNVRFRNLYMGGTGTFGGNITISKSTPFITLSNTAEDECGIVMLDSADAGQSAKITYDAGSSNALKFYNNAANERMRITSDGNVGIGVTPSATQTVTTQITNGLSLFGNNSTPYGFITNNHVWASGTGDTYLVSGYGASYYKQYQGIHSWATAPSGTAGGSLTFTERMRIDSNGSIGMGANSASYRLRVKSDATVQNGIYLSAGTGNGNHSLYVEDRDATAEFFAVRGDGEIRLNASNQGHTYARTGVRLGANAAANNLDDYEEGTWTPVAYASSGTIAGSYSEQLGTYTKIGRQVICMFDFTVTLSGTMVGFAGISGLPFAVGSSAASGGSMAGYSVNQFRSSTLFQAGGAGTQIKGFPQQGASYMYCQVDNSGVNGFGSSAAAQWNIGSVGRCTGFVIYFTD